MGLILHTEIGLGYETPWRQVEAMLLTAAARCAQPSGEPPRARIRVTGEAMPSAGSSGVTT